MENKTLFKVNQTVYDSALFGDLKGIITDDNYLDLNILLVKFGNHKHSYLYDGRVDIGCDKPTLSDKPYKVEYVPPQPQIELPKVGQMCYFWNDGMTGYYYAIFDYYQKGSAFPFVPTSGGFYQHCSTTNPTENEK